MPKCNIPNDSPTSVSRVLGLGIDSLGNRAAIFHLFRQEIGRSQTYNFQKPYQSCAMVWKGLNNKNAGKEKKALPSLMGHAKPFKLRGAERFFSGDAAAPEDRNLAGPRLTPLSIVDRFFLNLQGHSEPLSTIPTTCDWLPVLFGIPPSDLPHPVQVLWEIPVHTDDHV